MWDLNNILAMNLKLKTGDPSLELELYQAKHIVSRCKADPKEFATELYGALCNVVWKHRDSGSEFSCSWRYAGGIVSTMSHSVDDYMIYYDSGNEGVVTDDVRTELDKLGWEPMEDTNDERASAGSAP